MNSPNNQNELSRNLSFAFFDMSVHTLSLSLAVGDIVQSSCTAAEGDYARLCIEERAANRFLIHLPRVTGEGRNGRKAAITKAEDCSAYLTNCTDMGEKGED